MIRERKVIEKKIIMTLQTILSEGISFIILRTFYFPSISDIQNKAKA